MGTAESRRIYRRRINRVIDHIGEHLADPLSLDDLARVAHFSPFHFHRIFRTLVGEPVHTFVRRLRLERAVARMRHGPKTTLTAIALDCGFASSSDFSRAFKQAYGYAPRQDSRQRFLEESKIRQELAPNAGYDLGPWPAAPNPDRFRVRLVERPARRIAYVRVVGGYRPETVLAGFRRLLAWAARHGLDGPGTLIALSRDDPEITPMRKYRLDWCLVVADDLPDEDDDVSFGVIAANRYASLHCRGDIHKVARAWQHLYRNWLPGSGHHPTADPALEVFRGRPAGQDGSTFDLDCCLPVRPLPGR